MHTCWVGGVYSVTLQTMPGDGVRDQLTTLYGHCLPLKTCCCSDEPAVQEVCLVSLAIGDQRQNWGVSTPTSISIIGTEQNRIVSCVLRSWTRTPFTFSKPAILWILVITKPLRFGIIVNGRLHRIAQSKLAAGNISGG